MPPMRTLGFSSSLRLLSSLGLVLALAGGCADECSYDVDCPGTQVCVSGSCADERPTEEEDAGESDGAIDGGIDGGESDGGSVTRPDQVSVVAQNTVLGGADGGLLRTGRALAVAYVEGPSTTPTPTTECSDQTSGSCTLTLCSPIPVTDAGVDAGVDGGESDAGFDAGFDAGADAGVDAGFDAGPPPVLAAGNVSATYVDNGSFSTVSLVAAVDSAGNYVVTDSSPSSAYWPETPGGELTVRVAGGSEVPVPATMNLSVPSALMVSSPVESELYLAGADLAVTTTAALNHGELVVSVASANADGDSATIACRFAAGTSSYTVPGSLFSALFERTGATAYVSATAEVSQSVALDSATALSVSARTNVRNSVGNNFQLTVTDEAPDAGVPDAGVDGGS